MAIVVVSISNLHILTFLLYLLHEIIAANGCNQNLGSCTQDTLASSSVSHGTSMSLPPRSHNFYSLPTATVVCPVPLTSLYHTTYCCVYSIGTHPILYDSASDDYYKPYKANCNLVLSNYT